MQPPEVERESLVRRIYDINEKDFEGVAMEVWKFQYNHNALYRAYCDLLHVEVAQVRQSQEIPFLPIVMFREHNIKTGQWVEETIFRSSGTTESARSRHLIRDLQWYHKAAGRCFSMHFGNPDKYTWLGLLPSYLDRQDSSLVDMVHYFMLESDHPGNAFYPEVNKEVVLQLQRLCQMNQPTILIGVTFALLDLFESHEVPVWNNLTVLETGGMKGRGPEITREELYGRMRRDHPGIRISSEYGMTELLSQSYKLREHFMPGPSMKIFIRDISDPLQRIEHGQRGVIDVIDLANIDTCAFVATDDLGISFPDGSFDVLGRLDNSDLRGCNLMYN